MHFQSRYFGSFDAPWFERSQIDLFSKETQNLFSDSFGFKNPILDFLKGTHLAYRREISIFQVNYTTAQK